MRCLNQNNYSKTPSIILQTLLEKKKKIILNREFYRGLFLDFVEDGNLFNYKSFHHSGIGWAGFGVNHLDIAPRYASILIGITNTCATVPNIIVPILVGSISKTGV